MTDPLDNFRRDAKALHTSYDAMDAEARARVEMYVKPDKLLKHADFLHVIAREQTFATWPAMKDAITRLGMDRAARQRRMEIAVINGSTAVIRDLAFDDPGVSEGNPMLAIALCEVDHVQRWLAKTPDAATQILSPRGRPIHQLAFSRVLQVWPKRAADMLSVAAMLVDAGADVSDVYKAAPETMYGKVTPLYGAIGFANNMVLAQWLLDQGANPTDPEALYHGCEIGHAEGIRMLCKAGADPNGTNALKRAMDFDDPEMVGLLLDAGTDPNEGHDGWTSLHHAALRMSSSEVCDLLLKAGADPSVIGHGISAYSAAKVYGNHALAQMMEPVPLSPEEELLAQAVTGDVPDGTYIDPNKLPEIYLGLVREFAGAPAKLDHLKALIKIGMPWDRGDGSGVTPVQIAGWQGQPEMLAYFLGLKPDLGHRNAYGGGIIGSTLNGAMNNPERAGRDYVECLRLILEEGVALPQNAIWVSGLPEVNAFLQDWAKRFPQQVIKHGFP
jgi:hypothetical protein